MCSCRGISSDRTTCPADRGSLDRDLREHRGVPFFLVFVVLAVLASFADRERFGWIEPPEGDRERSVRG